MTFKLLIEQKLRNVKSGEENLLKHKLGEKVDYNLKQQKIRTFQPNKL